MATTPFHDAVAADFAAVNQLIIAQLHSDVGLVENIGHYLVDAGGKRLRPVLVLLCANALAYADKRHIELAAIIEFIHTATLLHDDVVDMSELRRGRQTANAHFGNAPSVLVGDFLYSRAFQMMVAIGSMDIMEILSNTTNVIAEGEVQQLVNAGDPGVTESAYFIVIHKKTAALFEAACETAAALAGTTAEVRQGLKEYGYHLGLAFQLVDDALDYDGDASALGKNVGDDLAEGKPTLPLIYAMQHGDAQQRQLIEGAIRDGGSGDIEAIVSAIRACGALDYTYQRAREHSAEAQARLDVLPEGKYRQALHELAAFAVERSF